MSEPLLSLGDIPDEILLHVIGYLTLDLPDSRIVQDLSSIALTSRRLRTVALDESIWKRVCEGVISIAPDTLPEDEDKPLVLTPNLEVWRQPSFYVLWRDCLRFWEQHLGLWIAGHASTHSRMTKACRASAAGGQIVIDDMVIENTFDFAALRNMNISLGRDPNGTIYILVVDDGEDDGLLAIDCFDPSPRLHRREPVDMDMEKAFSPQGLRRTHKAVEHTFEWNVRQPARLHLPPSTDIYPTPSLFESIRGARITESGDMICSTLYGHQIMDFARSPDYIPIHWPCSASWDQSLENPIDSGIYAARLSVHGVELFQVVFRTLTEADVETSPLDDNLEDEDLRMYPWDFDFRPKVAKHYGPFTSPGESCNRHLDCNRIRKGQRIFEATKITGDPNVPKGQRSIVGFLDIDDSLPELDPSAADPSTAGTPLDWSERTVSADLQVAQDSIRRAKEQSQPIPPDAMLPSSSRRQQIYPWPMRLVSAEEGGLPPFIPQPFAGGVGWPGLRPRALSYEEMMSPGAGWTCNGFGRIALTNFKNPSWVPAFVHFDARNQFSVKWMGQVTMFKRLDRGM